MVFLIRAHSGAVHDQYLLEASSFSEAEKIFNSKHYEDIDSIEKLSNGYSRLVVETAE